MKLSLRFLLVFALFFSSTITYGQSRTIPEDNSFTASGTRYPFGTNFGFEYFRAYYTSREVGTSGGTIYTLSWFMEGFNNPGNTPIEIRLGATTDTILTMANFTYTEAGTNAVFSSTLATSFFNGTPGGRWLRFTLTTPFVLPAGSNLMVLVKTSAGGTGNEASLAKSIRRLNSGDMTSGPWRAVFWQSHTAPIPGSNSGTFTIIRPNIKIGYSPVVTNDVGIESIISPITVCGPSTPVSVRAENNGTAATGAFSVSYRLNNGPVTTLPVSNIAVNGAAAVVNFPTQALSGNGPFVFKFWTTMAGDMFVANDTMIRTLSRPLNFATVTFDGFTDQNLSSIAPGWSEAAGQNVPSGTTSHWNASSFAAYGSVGATMFMFNTDPARNHQWLVGPSFIANTSSAIRLRVSKTSGTGSIGGATSASMGDDSLKIMVSTNCGTSWRRVGAITILNNLTDVFQTITLPLNATAGQEIRVALLTSAGTTNTGDSYQLNIDDISLASIANADISPLAIISPALACGLTTTTPISVQFYNYGQIAQTNVPVFYSVNNQAAVAGTLPSIGTNASANFTFATTANLTISNQINLRVWSGLGTDLIKSNDTISRNYNQLNILSLTTFNGFGFHNLPQVTNNLWQEHGGPTLNNVTPNNASSWGTSNVFTGLNAAFGSAASISIGNYNTKAWLVSTGIKLMPSVPAQFRYKAAISNPDGSALVNPGMGADDSLKILISTNCGASWQVLASHISTSGLTNSFQSFTVSLNAYSGQDIRIALKATDGVINNNKSYYMTVDDLEIVYPPAVELSMEAILNPVGNACGLSSTAPIVVRIRNLGSSTSTNMAVSYRINNGAVVNQNVPESIPPNGVLNYVLSSTANLSSVGSYNFTAWTDHPSDNIRTNDTLKNHVVNNLNQISSYPYLESFESGNGSWFAGGPGSSWVLGTPNKPNLTVAGDGTKAWVNGGLGTAGYAAGEFSHVISPCFNFTGLVRPWIEMKVWWRCEAKWDGMALQYTTNNGTNWILADNTGGLNGYNNVIPIDGLIPLEPSGKGWTGDFSFSSPPSSEGWKTTRFALTALAGQAQVRFRIVFGTDGLGREGVGFDAVRIYDAPDKNLALTKIITPTSCGIHDTMRVRVNVRNEGKVKQDFYAISYQIENQPVITEYFTDNINPGITRTLTFPFHLGSFTSPANNMKAWVKLPDDDDEVNDSVAKHLTIFVGNGLTNTNFSEFNGSNIATVFPGWREGKGAAAPNGDESLWTFGNDVQRIYYGSPIASVQLWNGNPNSWLITRPFMVVPNAVLGYDLAISNTAGNAIGPGTMGATHKMEVRITTNCGSSWAVIHTITKDSVLTMPMIRRRVALNAYAGNIVQIAFFATVGPSPDGSNIMLHIDNVQAGPINVPLSMNPLWVKSNCYNEQAQLKWQASSAKNRIGFEVQRSTNGLDFSYVGALATNPNPDESVLQNYSFIDKKKTNETAYYRLKILYLDNEPSYSNTVLIKNCFASSGGLEISAHKNKSQKLQFNINSDQEMANANIRIINGQGAIILNTQSNINMGDNVVLMNGLHLAPGMYVVLITKNNKQANTKFMW